MPTSNSNNSQTCTLDTEHTLATITTAGAYVLTLDVNALVALDVLVVRVKVKVRSAGTTRLADQFTIGPLPPTEKVWWSAPYPIVNEVVFTIEQTDGTGRAIPWEILSL